MSISRNEIIYIENTKYKKCLDVNHNDLVNIENMYSYKSNKNRIIVTNYCKNCNRQRRIDRKLLKRQNGGMEWALWNSAKDSSRARKLEFSLKLEDIEIPEICPILKISLINDIDFHKNNKTTKRFNIFEFPNYPTLDRIDSSKGYIKGNTHVISWRANSLKKDATLKEIEQIYFWWKNN